jgi:lysophospholipase L1-like esterase
MKIFDTIPRKTAMTIAALAVLALPQAIRVGQALPPVLPGAPALPRPVPASDANHAAARDVSYLTVPAGSLDTFYAALRRTELKEPGAVTRILHYGDSPTTADSITSDVRRLLQARFGDAGHGFLLIAKPWAWYGHAGTELAASGWKIAPASQSRERDGIHGLGGVSFRGGPGATSLVTLSEDHTDATISYLAQPGGGDFAVQPGDADPVTIHTADDEKHLAFAHIALPAGAHTLRLIVTSGNVRLFGYRFDKDQPGIQYSSLGINGAQVEMVARYFEVRQWTEALQQENPDLVVLNYGTNESIYPEYVERQYPEELRTVIGRIRAALPHASLLVMAPMDRGEMKSGEVVTPPAMELLIEQQRKIAAETGCAFFNTFLAMGGAGTMGRWYEARPRLVSADFMHPLPAGAAIVGGLFEGALIKSYVGQAFPPVHAALAAPSK